ncbi:MAG: penicillin acylase family protein [Pseudomonadota bacterium]
MARLFKWLFWLAGGIVILALIAVGAVWMLATQSVRSDEGSMTLAGLDAPVSIVRDQYGIPHIEAETRADAARALGFAHAQDRMWQMEVLRMTGQGRLSEMFGSPTRDIDVFLRMFDLAGQVSSTWDAMPAKYQTVLEAYAEGVNAWMGRETSLLEAALPPEFMILGRTPDPWQPKDSLYVLKLLGVQLVGNMDQELKRLQLAAQGLSPAEIEDILPGHRDDTAPPLPDLRQLYGLQPPGASASLSPIGSHPTFAVERYFGKTASNAWTFTGARTQSGQALLANDPHLAFEAPSFWYLAHMRWKDDAGKTVNLVGATIPTLPLMVVGRSDAVAWGLTTAGADVQDLYVERVKGDDPTQYLTPDGWRAFEERPTEIKISGGEPYRFVQRTTRNGPLLPRTFRDIGALLPKNHEIAIRTAARSYNDPSFQVLMDVEGAQTVEEFGRLTRNLVAPMQTIVVADKDGGIALFAPASVPKRKAENTMAGRAPVPGWDAIYDWDGFVAPGALPAIVNPSVGGIGTANSRFVTNNSNPMITLDWDEPFRQDRVASSLVQATTKHTVDTMVAGHLDSQSPAFVALRDIVVDSVEVTAQRKPSLDILRAWDGRMDTDAAAPLIMAALFREAHKVVFQDDLKSAYGASLRRPASSLLRVLAQGGARDWCDDATTAAAESCGQTLGKAVDAALSDLRSRFGEDPSAWRYGAAHTVYNEHRPFSRVWPLSLLFTIENPTSGGAYALLRAKPDIANKRNPYRAVHGAGYRAVYDFSDLDASRFIQSTGQSGHVMSQHYSDLAKLWAEGRYVTIPADPAKYRAAAQGTWRLVKD